MKELVFIIFIIKVLEVANAGFWKRYGTSCYYISTDTRRYSFSAYIQCMKYGGYLLEVNTMDEHNLITTELDINKEYWVGLQPNTIGDLVWINNGSKPIVAHYWDYYGNSQNLMARYGYNGGIWKLKDIGDSRDYRYVCEKDISFVTAITCQIKSGHSVELHNKFSSQSSNFYNDPSIYGSGIAIDIETKQTCAATNFDDDPWWQIDLEEQMIIYSVSVAFSSFFGYDSQRFTIQTFITDPNEVYFSNICGTFGISTITTNELTKLIQCRPFTVGRYLRITKHSSGEVLQLCDVSIEGSTCTIGVTENTCSGEKNPDSYSFAFQNKDLTNIGETTVIEEIIPSYTVSSCQYSTNALNSVVNLCNQTLEELAGISETSQTFFNTITSTFISPSITTDFETSSDHQFYVPSFSNYLPPVSSVKSISSSSPSILPAAPTKSSAPLMSSSTILDTFEEVIRDLKINEKTIGSYQRKLKCAEDNRMSSRAAGYIGIVTLVFVFAVLLFFDLIRLFRFFQRILKLRT